MFPFSLLWHRVLPLSVFNFQFIKRRESIGHKNCFGLRATFFYKQKRIYQFETVGVSKYEIAIITSK